MQCINDSGNRNDLTFVHCYVYPQGPNDVNNNNNNNSKK